VYWHRVLFLFLLLFLLFTGSEISAQCCAQGSPAPGTSNAGIIDAGSLRVISFYRYSYADKYYIVNKPAEFNFLQKSDYHYWGNLLSYGITKKITAETELGYYIQKKQVINNDPPVELSGHGLNNIVVSLKYPLLKSIIKNYEWSLGAGLKIPLQKTPVVKDNVRLPVDVQPSTLAYGNVFQSFLYKGLKNDSIKLFLINRLELNYENELSYRYGNSFSTSLFVAAPAIKSVTGILQLRHEYKLMNRSFDKKLINTGGHIAFISPQINYSFGKWNASFLVDFPVWRHYNGTQLGNKYSLTLNVVRTFCF
jgi:hypothetical protein